MECVTCGNLVDTTGRKKHAKYCSRDCRKEAYRRASGRVSSYDGIPSSTVGAISELTAATYFMKKGWNIFRAVSPACFCDLVAYKNGEPPMFLEVRTGYKSLQGVLTFGKKIRDGATHFVVVEHEGDRMIHLFPKDI